MTEQYPDDEALRRKAERRVKERMGLAWHAASYLIVNVFLWAIWLIIGLSSDEWYPWPVWATLGWGIGLAFHAFGYYTGTRGEARREDQIQKEMERLRNQK